MSMNRGALGQILERLEQAYVSCLPDTTRDGVTDTRAAQLFGDAAPAADATVRGPSAAAHVPAEPGEAKEM